MKKFFMLALVLALLCVVPPASVQAQGPPGEWVSTIFCVNQENSEGSISVNFYNEGSSTPSDTITDTIAAYGSKYYYPGDLAGLGSFSGSVTLSSSTGVSCSAQTSSSAYGTKADPFRFGASGGFSSSAASPVMHVSQVIKNFSSGQFGWYESYIAIQNTSASSVQVSVQYADRALGTLPAATRNYTIQGNSSVIVYLEENNDLPVGFMGSAKVSAVDPSSTPLAVQAVFYNDGTGYAKAQFHMYNGVPQGESVLYAPFVMRNFYDFNSGMNVVNVGDTATYFKIVFLIGRATSNEYVYTHPVQLLPGRVASLYMPDLDALDPIDRLSMTERAGQAIIYATDASGNPTSGELIANVNYRNDGRDPNNPNFGGQAVTYNAVGASEGSQVLYAPNIQNNVGAASFTSGFTVANLTGTGGTCTYTFVDDPTLSWVQPLPANGIYSVLVSNIPGLDDGYSSAAIIECTVNAMAIVTLRGNASNYWGDSQTAINALIGNTPY
jgi:hypothetical protein